MANFLTGLSRTCLNGIRDGAWLTRQRMQAYAWMFVVAYVLAIVGWVWMADGLCDHAGNPLGTDFLNVYAAGLMAHNGYAAQVYDWTTHRAMEHAVIGFEGPYYGWHYPPMFLIIAGMVALAPYLWALGCYLLAGFIGYMATIRRIAPDDNLSLWASAAFPGVFINIGNGQNGFITTALLGSGLFYLERDPYIAGFFLGLLSYKPQFFVLIPLLLLAGRYFRAFIATCLSALITMALSYAWFGLETWQAFFDSAHLTQNIILEQGATGWNKIQSVFSLVRMWGGGTEIAYGMQIIAGITAILCALIIWHKPTSLATRAASFVAAALLVTPYMLDYDLMVLALPVAFLTRQGLQEGFLPYEKTFLALLWLLPFVVRFYGSVGIMLTPFVMMGLMVLCWKRIGPSELSR